MSTINSSLSLSYSNNFGTGRDKRRRLSTGTELKCLLGSLGKFWSISMRFCWRMIPVLFRFCNKQSSLIKTRETVHNAQPPLAAAGTPGKYRTCCCQRGFTCRKNLDWNSHPEVQNASTDRKVLINLLSKFKTFPLQN